MRPGPRGRAGPAGLPGRRNALGSCIAEVVAFWPQPIASLRDASNAPRASRSDASNAPRAWRSDASDAKLQPGKAFAQ